MSSRDEYVRKMQAKLAELNADIDKLAAKAGEVSAELKSEYNQEMADLKKKQAAARQKLEAMQKSGESAWQDLKAGIDLAWTAIGESIDSAKSRFK
jgi:chromosome segregation ATPase